MKDLVTPKQVAQAIDVSESSLKRWCDQGLIPSVRTAGGHRRLPVNGVLTFLRKFGYEIRHPELLGLPPATLGGHVRKVVEQRDRLIQAMVEGNEEVGVEIVLNAYLAKIPMSVICDDLLHGAYQEISGRLAAGKLAVYQERRANELCQRVVYEVRRALPELPPTAPLAVGGTVDGDSYTLASSMAELVLRELGWRASSLGSMLPLLSLRQAICDTRPRLFWLSMSVIRDVEMFLVAYDSLSQLAKDNDVALVIGGAGITDALRANAVQCLL
ncbi:helix-turn-helix domain-containing protein [Planctomicrobium sp. SH664]|uniref:cobalamin B12-binding domain-containing protein n=1 Tax=Planctomicrobium sp. SH664 TaxID=3448125 RepID=UPI003F5B669F